MSDVKKGIRVIFKYVKIGRPSYRNNEGKRFHDSLKKYEIWNWFSFN